MDQVFPKQQMLGIRRTKLDSWPERCVLGILPCNSPLLCPTYRPDAGLQGESGIVLVPKVAHGFWPLTSDLPVYISGLSFTLLKIGKINTFRETGGIQDVLNCFKWSAKAKQSSSTCTHAPLLYMRIDNICACWLFAEPELLQMSFSTRLFSLLLRGPPHSCPSGLSWNVCPSRPTVTAHYEITAPPHHTHTYIKCHPSSLLHLSARNYFVCLRTYSISVYPTGT